MTDEWSLTGTATPIRPPLVGPYRSSDPVPVLDLRVTGAIIGRVAGTRSHRDGRCSILVLADHDGNGVRVCELPVEPDCFVARRYDGLFGELIVISAEDVYDVEPKLGLDLFEHERLVHCHAGWRLRTAYEACSTSGHHHAVAKRERTRAAWLDHRATADEAGCGCSAEIVIVTVGEAVPGDVVLPKPELPAQE